MSTFHYYFFPLTLRGAMMSTTNKHVCGCWSGYYYRNVCRVSKTLCRVKTQSRHLKIL